MHQGFQLIRYAQRFSQAFYVRFGEAKASLESVVIICVEQIARLASWAPRLLGEQVRLPQQQCRCSVVILRRLARSLQRHQQHKVARVGVRVRVRINLRFVVGLFEAANTPQQQKLFDKQWPRTDEYGVQ